MRLLITLECLSLCHCTDREASRNKIVSFQCSMLFQFNLVCIAHSHAKWRPTEKITSGIRFCYAWGEGDTAHNSIASIIKSFQFLFRALSTRPPRWTRVTPDPSLPTSLPSRSIIKTSIGSGQHEVYVHHPAVLGSFNAAGSVICFDARDACAL